MTQHDLSRRTFLSGAMVAAGAATLGTIAGCTPAKDAEKTASEQTASGGTAHSWDVAPEPITDIKETRNCDLLVIGAGIAGLSAACSAAEQGLDVICVEKTDVIAGGLVRTHTVGALSSRYMKAEGVELDRAAAQGQWNRTCGNRCDERLVNKWFDKSTEALEWALDKCEKNHALVLLLPNTSKNNKVNPECRTGHMILGGDGSENPGEYSLGRWLRKDAEAAGARFYFKSPAVQLIQENGAVVGAVCKTDDGYIEYRTKKGVALATGDIGGDQEMMEAYAPEIAPMTAAGKTMYTPIGANTGDGHKMGMWVGAQLQDLPLPTITHMQMYACMQPAGCLVVNQNGERFMNEDVWIQGRALNVGKQPGYVGYWLLDGAWHEKYLDSLNYGGGVFWNGYEDLDSANAWIEGAIKDGNAWKADTIEDLAKQMNIDAATLRATVDRYNEMSKAGEDADYHKRKELMYPYEKGPYIGLKNGASLLVVCGGLKVDLDSRCLDADGKPIPGLFALGNVQGNLFARDCPLTIQGASHGRCLTFGYELGKYLAKA